MAFEDFISKLESKGIEAEKPRFEIVDKTMDLALSVVSTDFITQIKRIPKLKKILANVDEMNLYKRGWRFQFGTSREWAGLCSSVESSVYKSKVNKNLFVSIEVVKGDDNWKDNMKSTIYHEVAHAIVKEIFSYSDSPSNIGVLSKIDSDHFPSKGHGDIWRAVCKSIIVKGSECKTYYANMSKNDFFMKFRYICNICLNKGYGDSISFAERCSKCSAKIVVQSNV